MKRMLQTAPVLEVMIGQDALYSLTGKRRGFSGAGIACYDETAVAIVRD